jgi:hypothetical protein
MSNFKKSLEYQQKVNEAVQAIFNHFKVEISYAETLETMTDAQCQIMQLMEINRIATANKQIGVPTDAINNFISEVNEIHKLLRPFANLMGQVYGNED